MAEDTKNTKGTPNAVKGECCDYWLKMAPHLSWYEMEVTSRGTSSIIKIMPHIQCDGGDLRVNFCPSCGKNVRDYEYRPK